MEKPKTIDPFAWAQFNQAIAMNLANAMQLPEPELQLEQYEIRIEETGPLNELFRSIRRAVGELEGQGEKSDRIALQLLTAMARFAADTEMP